MAISYWSRVADGSILMMCATQTWLGVENEWRIPFGSGLSSHSRTPMHSRQKSKQFKFQKMKKGLGKAAAAGKAFKLGSTNFDNVNTLKKKLKEIQNCRTDGEMLKENGGDYLLVVDLLKYHPKAATKTQDLKGIKVRAHWQMC